MEEADVALDTMEEEKVEDPVARKAQELAAKELVQVHLHYAADDLKADFASRVLTGKTIFVVDCPTSKVSWLLAFLDRF